MTIAIVLIIVAGIVSIFSSFAYMFLGWLLGLLSNISGTAIFDVPGVTGILSILSIWSGTIIVITIIALIIRLMLELSEGKQISLGANLRAIMVGLVLAIFGFDIGKSIFFLGEVVRKELVSKIVLPGTTFSEAVVDGIKKLLLGPGTDFITSVPDGLDSTLFSNAFTDLFAIVVVLVFIYQVFKLLVETFERTAQYFFVLIQMPLHVSMYINGNEQAITTWFKQLAVIMFGLAFRFIGVNLAFYILISPNTFFGGLTLFAVIGLLMATGKADNTLQSFGASSNWGGSGRMMTSAVSGGAHVASHMKSLFSKGAM